LPSHSRLPYRLLTVLAVTAALAAAAQPAAGAAPITRVPTLEEETLAAINQLRREHGLPTVRASAALASVAKSHSVSMAEHGYFSHASLGGSAFASRFGSGFRALGETMAWASPGLSARRTLALWLRSPSHRQTLLSPTWRVVGLGAVHAVGAPGAFRGLDVTILTVDFGLTARHGQRRSA
jgi:uncharacterized protein YkwD